MKTDRFSLNEYKSILFDALIPGFSACSAFGEQASGFGTLLLKTFASGHFGVNTQRSEHFKSVAVFQGMRYVNRFAPDGSLPVLVSKRGIRPAL